MQGCGHARATGGNFRLSATPVRPNLAGQSFPVVALRAAGAAFAGMTTECAASPALTDLSLRNRTAAFERSWELDTREPSWVTMQAAALQAMDGRKKPAADVREPS